MNPPPPVTEALPPPFRPGGAPGGLTLAGPFPMMRTIDKPGRERRRTVMNSKEDRIGSAETPQKILDAAIELFAANGFKGTSIREIAKVTGMTVSNIYYYFGSKEGVLFAILERSNRKIVERLNEAAACDLEPLERLRHMLRTLLALILEPYRQEARILFLDEERHSELRKRFQLEILDIYRRELRGLMDLGILPRRDATALAFHVFGVINWHLRWYRPGGRLTLEEAQTQMIDFVLHGAMGPPTNPERG